MNVRTFRAPTMAEALALVKRDLGPGAVILHTRSVRVGGILGWRARTAVEITAADEATVRPRRAAIAPQSVRSPAPAFVPSATAVAAYRGMAGAGAEGPPTNRAAAGAPASEPPPQQVPPRPVQAVPQPADESMVMQVRSRKGVERAAPTPGLGVSDPSGSLYRELADIKLLVNQVLHSAPAAACVPGSANMPEALFRHYLKLLESQVSRELADAVLSAVRDELSTAELADEQIVRAAVLRHLGALIPVAEGVAAPSRAADGRPHTVALVGPTGVGKTTTVAKLAAAYKLRHGRSVGLITSDTYRIAAVEQLRTYASIIGLPLRVAMTPAEMGAAVESFRACDVVLIDTAGRSQHAADRLAELEQFLAAASPHETHLVLSTASGEDVLVRAAESFARVRPNRVLLTKLDEAVNFGVVANTLRRLSRSVGPIGSGALPLSFVTTGQEVPDHIEPGCANRLARMILDNQLGEEGIGPSEHAAATACGGAV
ncbi:MAG: flagellar biosynthesis protein FlhF [Phycisphaeraceae bacterium]|nr:flagellar biosynthesis protein FlhF [Phycisphaeraceae bacterium]